MAKISYKIVHADGSEKIAKIDVDDANAFNDATAALTNFGNNENEPEIRNNVSILAVWAIPGNAPKSYYKRAYLNPANNTAIYVKRSSAKN